MPEPILVSITATKTATSLYDLRGTWRQTTASRGGVANQVNGIAPGEILQAGDITDDITF